MPNERAADLAELADGISQNLNPVGELEQVLVDRIIALTWRLCRVEKIEAGILTRQYTKILAERAAEKANEIRGRKRWENPSEDEQKLLAEMMSDKPYVKARAEQHKHQEEQKSEVATWGEAFVRDSRDDDALLKLSRYENSIQRNWFRNLHELQRAQAARQGEKVPLPAAVDIDVSGVEGAQTGSAPTFRTLKPQ
jgi:hypothetical protein